MLRRLLCCCLLITLLPILPTHAQESADAVRQTFENIVYLVDGEQITMLVSVGVTHAPTEPLTWLIPVPAEPLSIEFAVADALAEFEQATEPYPLAPDIPCQLSKRSSVVGGDYRFQPPEIIGADMLDYAVFGGAPAEQVIIDIGAAGYALEAWMEYVINTYPPGTHFVMLRAVWPEPGETISEYDYRLPLVVVEYASDTVEVLTGVVRHPVTVWTVGASQYAPARASAPLLPNWSNIYQNHTHQVFEMGRLVVRQFLGEHAHVWYSDARNAAGFNNPPNFTTEYAGDLEGYFSAIFSADLLPAGFDHDYVTRLYTRSRDIPAWVTDFGPAPDFPDVPREVDLNDYVDSLRYWGCSNWTGWLSGLPDARTRIDALWMDVAHPDGWVLSEITWDEQITLYVLAPEPMTRESIATFAEAQTGPPFFLAFEQVGPPDVQRAEDDIFEYWYDDAARDAFKLVFGADVVAGDMRLRYWPYGGDTCALERAVVYGIFQSADDNTVHMFEQIDMFSYVTGFQYFASAELPHTLFLNDDFGGEGPILMIPYPAGWSAQLDADDNVQLTPEDGSVTVIVERDAADPGVWEMRIEGDSASWTSEIDAIGAGITTESACSAARG